MLPQMQAISTHLFILLESIFRSCEKLGDFIGTSAKVEGIQLFLRLTPTLSERFLSLKLLS